MSHLRQGERLNVLREGCDAQDSDVVSMFDSQT